MLKLELGIPPKSGMDFDFNDARPMPFLSAPSTPRRFGDFSISAPSSPSRMEGFYRSFHDFEDATTFGGVGSKAESSSGGDDFAFDFRSDLEENSLYAEELFDGGKIKLLKPQDKTRDMSPIAKGQKIIREVFSTRKKKDYSDEDSGNERGRERGTAGLTSKTSRRAARSLSPYRVSEYPWEEEEGEEEEERKSQETTKKQLVTTHNSKTSKSSSKKWRLKDFLLFRSASEGRASDKHYKYYPSFFKKPEDHAKNSSLRSTESGTGSGTGTRKKGQMSAHELHYKTNKAASEDLKKKTYLPYKQGILGKFAFSPTHHLVANGFGSHHT